MKKNTPLFLFIFLNISFLCAQQKRPITLDDVWKNPIWREKGVDEINWFKSGSTYSALEDENVEVYDIKTGLKVKTLIQGKDLMLDTVLTGNFNS